MTLVSPTTFVTNGLNQLSHVFRGAHFSGLYRVSAPMAMMKYERKFRGFVAGLGLLVHGGDCSGVRFLVILHLRGNVCPIDCLTEEWQSGQMHSP
jgi:hypothetical protein